MEHGAKLNDRRTPTLNQNETPKLVVLAALFF
jgi:hypothetical protein